MMWQNAGKSGLDQWNFTMNPTSKAQDPDGKYTRRWVPEVAGLPNKLVHAPWEASAEQLLDADVVLGLSYPHRIPSTVDVGAARDRNRLAILQARKAGANWSDAGGYDQIVVPKGASTVHDGMKMRVFTVPKYDTSGLGGPGERIAETDIGNARYRSATTDKTEAEMKQQAKQRRDAKRAGKGEGVVGGKGKAGKAGKKKKRADTRVETVKGQQRLDDLLWNRMR